MKCEMIRHSKKSLVRAPGAIVLIWIGFQILSQSNQHKKVSIGFIPTIPAQPNKTVTGETITN